MKKLGILVLSVVCCLFFVFYTVGCGTSSSDSATTTAPSTSTSTTTTTAGGSTTTTTSTSTTSTTVFSSLSGTVNVPASLVSSGIRISSISEVALANAIITAVGADGNQIAGSSTTTSDASGNFTLNNVPLDQPFYIKATKETSGNIILAKDVVSMESSAQTGEAVNALSSVVSQRIENILDNAGVTSFESLNNIDASKVGKWLKYEIGSLASAPDMSGASESAVESNLLTSYNTLTSESSTLESIDGSSNAQLLVGAATTSDDYKIASWKFFEAAGFGMPTIESLSLVGHGGLNSAMPAVTESIIDTCADYLEQGYRWNVAGVVTALNQVASWEVHYTQTSDPTSAAQQTLLTPAILSNNGGDISLAGVINTSQNYDVITDASTPNVLASAFGNLLYGTIPSYEGYCNLIRGLEQPSSPTWETPSLIKVATLAFPASFWDTTPNDSNDDGTFDANTQLDVLQAYAIIYLRILKIQSLSSPQEPPYYNDELRLQFDSRPSIEAELLEYLDQSKL